MEFANQAGIAKPIAKIIKNSDLVMPLGVVGVLCVMLMPMPTFLLDLLLSLNITLGLVILLVSMYVLRPLELSSFPSILLLVTLFRLSLNVASTRMILLHGSEGTSAAGKVIQAFGGFVVGGNYVVGIIVFLILVLINFLVIVKGAGRIAEVAARFTLDAMPGKQMSIDADLNAGLINEDEARSRRQELSRESEYYGAMDGANKFVRGDAIAGIVITLINIIGGLLIGVFQQGMGFGDAAQTYTLLTVGDGLVSQVPALIISTSAGIIVTRAGSESSLGREVSSQVLNQPRAIMIAAGVLFGFGMVPGMPTIPFWILAILAGGLAYGVATSQKDALGDETMLEPVTEPETSSEGVTPLPPLDILALEVGYGLIPLVDVEQDGELLDRIKSFRRQLAQEIGIVVPSIHIQDNMQLKPGEYAIYMKENKLAGGEMMVDHFLAMNPGHVVEEIEGMPTQEPTYGLPAVWIKSSSREKALAEGYTVVDLATVMITHLSDVVRHHAHELVGRQEVQQLLDHLKETHPKVVEELVPNILPLGGVVKVLQNLLREQVPVRDLLAILETLADWGTTVKDSEQLTEYVRRSLARTISRLYQGPDGSLQILTFDPEVEQTLTGALQQTDTGKYLALEPSVAQTLMRNVNDVVERVSQMNIQPVLLCATHLRPHFKRLVDRFIPELAVLSYDEILSDVNIQSVGTITLSHAD